MTEKPADHAAFRQALREEKLSARLALPAAAHAATSARVLGHLAALFAGRPAARIGLCVAVRGEVDCLPLATDLHRRGWDVAMPVVEARAAPMVFRSWWPGAPMSADPHGIPVPATLPCPPPQVLLIPLLAFDAAGFRLGYGGGYFDRTLATCDPRPQTLGVGFELARVPSIAPQAHDIPLDAIVTEHGVQRHRTP